MLKNKLREKLGGGGRKSWGRRLGRSTPDSDLMAEIDQVKGHFLYLF